MPHLTLRTSSITLASHFPQTGQAHGHREALLLIHNLLRVAQLLRGCKPHANPKNPNACGLNQNTHPRPVWQTRPPVGKPGFLWETPGPQALSPESCLASRESRFADGKVRGGSRSLRRFPGLGRPAVRTKPRTCDKIHRHMRLCPRPIVFGTLAVLFLANLLSLAFAQSEPRCARTTPSGPSKLSQNKQDRRYAVTQGLWSSATVSLFNTGTGFDDNPGRNACFYSPDGKKQVEIHGTDVSISMAGKVYELKVARFTAPELGWSPDSSRIFVTWTEATTTNAWQTDVYDIMPEGLIPVNGLFDRARMDFEKRVRELPMDPLLNDNEHDRAVWEGAAYCEPYNVVGSHWLKGSKELVFSVLVPNTSACRYMTEFNVYRVSVPAGDILERYTAVEAHKNFDPTTLPRIVRPSQ